MHMINIREDAGVCAQPDPSWINMDKDDLVCDTGVIIDELYFGGIRYFRCSPIKET